jgi:hypothetical protein
VIQRFFTSLVAVAVVVGIACVDMSAPSGPASISSLQLPSPSVIVGDVMRDSNGVAAPLRVIAYDAAGTPMTGVTVNYFITDTIRAARLGNDNVLTGDKIGVVRIVGQVGSLQTPVATIPVTHMPARLSTVASSGKTDTLRPAFAGDSATSAAAASAAFNVRSVADSGSQGIIVRFTLVRAPTSLDPKRPAAFLADDSNNPSVVDTTDQSGQASRRVVVIAAFLGDKDVLAGKPDSAIVEARAFYKGVALTGSPARLVIPVKLKPAF